MTNKKELEGFDFGHNPYEQEARLLPPLIHIITGWQETSTLRLLHGNLLDE